MSKIYEEYTIRLATIDDIPAIMQFIRDYWKTSHILGNNLDFFRYEMVINGQVNFILAELKTTGSLEGIHGFIPASVSETKKDIWGVMWKVKKDATPGLGMELKRKLKELTHARMECGVGLNPKTALPILRFMKYRTGRMRHYYMLSNRDEYKIALIRHFAFEGCAESQCRVEQAADFELLLERFDFSVLEECKPYKDGWYIEHRYFQHPIYQYQVFLISEPGQDKARGILVTREQHAMGSTVLRIIDFIGQKELFAGLGTFFCGILDKYEYIDIYVAGVDNAIIQSAGFTERAENDENILPDYFAPYVRKNVDIWVESTEENCTFFKGDGDQDRPS